MARYDNASNQFQHLRLCPDSGAQWAHMKLSQNRALLVFGTGNTTVLTLLLQFKDIRVHFAGKGTTKR